MFSICKKLVSVGLIAAVTLIVAAFTIVEFGGEIPWPLSVQHPVTVEHSKGLWKLGDGQSSRLFNVEMRTDSQSGFVWIRVAEMDPESMQVYAWGDGYFSPSHTSDIDSSYSNIHFDKPGQNQDKMGRYVTMFPNGDTQARPYVLRMVEVETTLGNVLGLSILDYKKMDYDHFLGTRVMDEPMSCDESRKKGLTCYLSL
jgi:hypothetical protein